MSVRAAGFLDRLYRAMLVNRRVLPVATVGEPLRWRTNPAVAVGRGGPASVRGASLARKLIARLPTDRLRFMDRMQLRVSVAGGDIVGWVEGSGLPVLLLHGGPVGYEYLEGLAAEFLPDFAVAAFQQRGVSPSTLSGPYDMETEAADVKAVLDELGWDRTYVVGHSLGGYYALQLCRRLPERMLGALIVDPLGAVGDGGMDEFWECTARPVDGCRPPPRRRDRPAPEARYQNRGR